MNCILKPKSTNLTGKRFGLLKVIEFNGYKKVGKSVPITAATWLCLCDCGNQKIVVANSLKRGYTKSCGCIHKFPPGVASSIDLISKYRYSANKRGYDFSLSYTQSMNLFKYNCYYCGVAPEGIYKARDKNGDFIYNGIDRIDNEQGYTYENCVACCKKCNISKGTMTIQEFKRWICRVYENIKLQDVK